jgi:hypothetical protein
MLSSLKTSFFLLSLRFCIFKYDFKFCEKTHLSYDLISDKYNKTQQKCINLGDHL